MAKDAVNVAIRVKHYKQLFDSLDPSPFLERDLDDDAADYIVTSVEEQASDRPVHIRIHITEPHQSDISESEIRESIHGYFAYQAENCNRRLRELVRVGRIFLVLGMVFLAVCLSLAEVVRELIVGQRAFLQVIPEGLVIMGWVAMWRPIEYFIYDWWPIVRRREIFRRLKESKIHIVHER